MREDEVLMKERMKSLSRDLGSVNEEYREAAANLKSVEELKNQNSHLDNEIKHKSEVHFYLEFQFSKCWKGKTGDFQELDVTNIYKNIKSNILAVPIFQH